MTDTIILEQDTTIIAEDSQITTIITGNDEPTLIITGIMGPAGKSIQLAGAVSVPEDLPTAGYNPGESFLVGNTVYVWSD
jgi:hypothetical protein